MDKHEVLREAQRRVLDADARQRRLRKALEILEQDNHVEEPVSESRSTKKPKFGEDDGPFKSGKNKKKRRSFCVKSGTLSLGSTIFQCIEICANKFI
ncbi:unnamed protein product [Dibothriocephalus latus]|uniref:Uncharacterized protein n=1 Tax=Dibothriocephalus latus TaxID=60516 RepID=A0A3P7PA43_DIBLA|nr:unnamed protein product [Dibothriocephalus latus]